MTATDAEVYRIPAAAVRDDDRTLIALLVENEGPEGLKEGAIAARFAEAAERAAADAGQFRKLHTIDAAGRELRVLVRA
jgi:hypothetical protein